MPVATAGAVRKQIKAGSPDPLYLLLGEDEVEKSSLAAEFALLVDEGLQAFNVERIHAGEMTTGDRIATGVATLISAARTLPMFAPWRVIVVQHAEMLLGPKRESEAATRALDALEGFIQQPERQTVVVFVASSIDKRARVYKVLAKHATVVEMGALEDQADAERWIRARVAAARVEIEPMAARLLAVRGGPDVTRLRADVERLLLYALGQKTITLEDARELAGPEVIQDDWAITNAIEQGRAGEALKQLALMLDAGAVPEKILGQLAWLVRSKFPAMAPGGLPAAVESVFRTDLDLKRSAGDPRILLERLVVELCGPRQARAASREARRDL